MSIQEEPVRLRPLRDRVLIQTVPPAKMIGSIHVPDSAQRTNSAEGVVSAIGPEVKQIAVGDRVLFEPMAMSEIAAMRTREGERVVSIPEENVIAVFERD